MANRLVKIRVVFDLAIRLCVMLSEVRNFKVPVAVESAGDSLD